jgi:hypothetical protein
MSADPQVCMMIGFPDVESALSFMNTTIQKNYAILHIGKVEIFQNIHCAKSIAIM